MLFLLIKLFILFWDSFGNLSFSRNLFNSFECLSCWNKAVYNIPLKSFHFCRVSTDASFISNLVISVFSLFLLLSPDKYLSIFLIFSKNELLISADFLYCFTILCIISFFLFYFFFSSCIGFSLLFSSWYLKVEV